MSALFTGSLVAALVFALAVVGVILGAIAIHKTTELNLSGRALVSPRLQQPLLVGGGTPTVELVNTSSPAAFSDATIGAGSTDTSGVIRGTLSNTSDASTLTHLRVTFSKPFPLVPTTVIITPANEYMAVQSMFTGVITATYFTVFFKKTTAGTATSAAQINYLVL